MKTALKKLIFVFIVIIVMTSCESHVINNPPKDHHFPYDPETLQKLHQNIRPSKPLKIPDTLRILTADPSLYIIQQDTVPQDSIPQDSIN